jgi:predicted secreted protein
MKKMVVAGLVVVMLFAAASAWAELCPKCRKMMFIMSIGKCVECGGMTTSGSHKLCPKCSAKLGECEHCRAKLNLGKVAPAPKQDDGAVGEVKVKAAPITLTVLAAQNGKAVTCFPNDLIEVRLRGNATTGFQWLPVVEKDGVLVLAGNDYEDDKINVPGAGGWSIVRYRAVKPGEGKVALEYRRPWEKTKPEQVFSVTVKVEADPTTERAAKLKADVESFRLQLQHIGESGKPFYNVDLSVPMVEKGEASLFSPWAQISEAQARRIIDHLAKDGYLRRAQNKVNILRERLPTGPTYMLSVVGPPDEIQLTESLGWDLTMLRRLEALREVCEGDARKAMDLLLGRMSGLKAEWEAAEKQK